MLQIPSLPALNDQSKVHCSASTSIEQLECSVMVIITVTIWALERCHHWYPGIHTQDIVRYIQSSYDIGLLTDQWLGRYQTQTVLFVTLLSPCSGSSASAQVM